MSGNKRGTLTGWGTIIGGLGTLVIAFVGYMSYAHPHGRPGQQTFSVAVGEERGSSDLGHRRESSVDFTVKKCDIGSKKVSCSISVVSPRYDRHLRIGYGTFLIDSDGDKFPLTNDYVNLTLERNQQLPLKLAFDVNKDVARPLTVKMSGSIDYETLDKGFEIK